MFIALELLPRREAGIFPRIAGILTRPKARRTEETAFGVRYLRLAAPLRKGEPDWGEIEELAGRLKTRILFPDDIPPPKEHPALRSLPCPRYECRVLSETANSVIQRSRIPLYKRVLGLIDRDGSFADLLPGLLRFYTSARVVTAREDLYEVTAERVMEELGATVLVGGTLSMLTGSVLVLAPGEACGEEEGRYPSPVLAGEAFRPELPCDLFRDPVPEITPELLASCPPGISPHRFSAALFEDAGAEAGAFVAKTLRLGGRLVTMRNTVWYATNCAERLSLY